MEIWDAYDSNMKPIGMDLVRGDPIPDGVYHLVCEVLVRHVDGDFLLMKRACSKPNYPGLYEATAGGSALKGENADQCIKRELFEETGIDVCDFQLVDVIICDRTHSIYHEYYCETDCEKDAICLQDGETAGYMWVDKAQFERMLGQRDIVPVTKERLRTYLNSELYI